MQKQEIDRLRTLPIEEVAHRLGLHPERHKCLCPFHNDHHASLTFRPSHGTFRCFVCGASGNVIDLVMRHLSLSFPQALQWLAQSQGAVVSPPKAQPTEPTSPPFDAERYTPHFIHPHLSTQAQQFLFNERKLDTRVVSWCRLSSWTDRRGTHWLQIPYFSPEGKLIGLQNRNLSASQPTIPLHLNKAPLTAPQPRFRFPRGARCSIYNLPVTAMLRPNEPLYITEGASDCWAMLSAGHKALAIPSATLLSSADKRFLKGLEERLHTPFHMYPDRDAPGEALFRQLKELLPSLTRHPLPSSCKDFAEFYLKNLAKQN